MTGLSGYVSGLLELLSGLPRQELYRDERKEAIPFESLSFRDMISVLLSYGRTLAPEHRHMLDVLGQQTISNVLRDRDVELGSDDYAVFVRKALLYLNRLNNEAAITATTSVAVDSSQVYDCLVGILNEFVEEQVDGLAEVGVSSNGQPSELIQLTPVKLIGYALSMNNGGGGLKALENAMPGYRVVGFDARSRVTGRGSRRNEGKNRRLNVYVSPVDEEGNVSPVAVRIAVHFGSQGLKRDEHAGLLEIVRAVHSRQKTTDQLYKLYRMTEATLLHGLAALKE